MGRGRNPSVSRDRVLAELLLHPDSAVFSDSIAENVPVGRERVRQILRELEDDGYVDIEEISGSNVYRLTESGYERVAKTIRSEIE